MKFSLDPIDKVLGEIKAGRMVIVVDDAGRENEGDLIMAGEKVTATDINFMARYGRGLICVPTTNDRLKQLGIEQRSFKTGKRSKRIFKSALMLQQASPLASVPPTELAPSKSWRIQPQCPVI